MRKKKIPFSMLKRSNPRIVLGQNGRGNIQNAVFDGVDYENNGHTYINQSTMRQNALTNTETGTMDVGNLALKDADLLNKGHIKAEQLSMNQRPEDERTNIGLMQRLVDRATRHWIVVVVTLVTGILGSVLSIIAYFQQ